ncbi:MAG TPA: hypothetical protein VFR33_08345 [Candidatus Dormibacteraeota bacterium]|nr:hypothetical protein [Candidatus Dormibacteraeota bacterium]
MSFAATAARATGRPPGISPDGMWYWDGRKWRSTTSNDGRWRWDGYDWIPLWSRRSSARAAERRPSAWVLLGLLALDLGVLIPGVGWAGAAVAAFVLLVMDARGLLTLNGLVKWRRMSFGTALAVAFLGLLLFEVVVFIYIVQRLFGFLPKPSWTTKHATHSRPVVVYEGTVDAKPQLETHDAESMKTALDAVVAGARKQLPAKLLTKLEAVVAAIDNVLLVYRSSDLTVHDRFIVERTIDDYLPSALNTYLKLPAAYRSSPLKDAGGKSADEVLSEQLDLLLERMTQVAEVAYKKDVEALLVHARFLHSKFGASGLTLKS